MFLSCFETIAAIEDHYDKKFIMSDTQVQVFKNLIHSRVWGVKHMFLDTLKNRLIEAVLLSTQNMGENTILRSEFDLPFS